MAAWSIMVYRLVNIYMEKIDQNRKFRLVIDIAKFNGYEKNFILKLIREYRWDRHFKNIAILEKNQLKKRDQQVCIPIISNKISKNTKQIYFLLEIIFF